MQILKRHQPRSFWLSNELLFGQGTTHLHSDSSPDYRLLCKQILQITLTAVAILNDDLQIINPTSQV